MMTQRYVLVYVGNGSREVVGHPESYVAACDMAEQFGKPGTYIHRPEGDRYGNLIEVHYGRAKGQLC